MTEMTKPPKTAPPPHRWTVTHTRIAIALAVLGLVVAALNYLKPSAGNVTATGNNGGAAAGVVNGTQIGTQNINAGTSQKDEIDPGIFIECYQRVRSARIPADSRIYLMDIHSIDSLGGFAVITGTPDTDYPLPGGLFNALRCSVTNYGPTRVNVLFNLHAKYLESVREGSAAHSGKIISERNLAAPIGRLEPGKGNQFDFYIVSFLEYFIEMELPNDATAQSLGSDETKTIKVAWPKAYTRIVFNPISTIPN